MSKIFGLANTKEKLKNNFIHF